jgi:anaerobic magnesium-protoporphyrin IX monomethyl ester cyclase
MQTSSSLPTETAGGYSRVWRPLDAKIDKLSLIYLHPGDFMNAFHSLLSGLQRRPKIGLEYVAGALAMVDFPAEIVDEHCEPILSETLVAKFRHREAPFVGFYSTSFNRTRVTAHIRILRRNLPHARIIVGGPGSYHAEMFLDAGADAVFVGEADWTIQEYVRFLADGSPGAEEIQGLVLRDPAGNTVRTPPRPAETDMQKLPWPERMDPRNSNYCDWVSIPMKRPYISALTSRGCPFHCTFCTSPGIWGNKVRLRSARDVFDELVDAHDRFGVRHINFQDDIFAWDLDWGREFMTLMKNSPIDFKYMAILHPFSFHRAREEMIERLVESGCVMVSYGAQAVDAQVLKNVRRSPNEPEALARHLELCNSYKLFNVITYIFGLPGSTRETMAKSRAFALEHKPTFVDYHPLGLLPGAQLGAIDEAMVGSPGGEFTIGELEALCSEALREFYFRPAALLRILDYTLRTNPGWLVQFPRYAITEAVKVYVNRLRPGREAEEVTRPGSGRWADGDRAGEKLIVTG